MTPQKFLIIAAVSGFVVRLIKTESANVLLKKLSLPAVPKPALPWVALVASFCLALASSMAEGAALAEAALLGLDGILAGAFAIAGQETLGPTMSQALPAAASVLFGKKGSK